MTDVDHELASGANGLLLAKRQLGALVVTGKDRQSWLNGLVTQDLVPRKVGDAAVALVVAKNGKIEAEVAILLGKEELTIGLPADLASSTRDKLDRHLIMEEAAIEVAPEPLEWVFGFGPLASEAVEIARELGATAGLTRRADHDLVIIAAREIGLVVNALTARLAEKGPIAIASAEGWLRFRIEHGIAERHADFAEDESYPQEAALEKDEVSFAKGCYLGQEAVFMLEKRGHVSKRLVQIVSPSIIEVGAEVRDADAKSIGKITSVSSRGTEAIALAMVKYKHARTAHEINVDAASVEGGVKAQITSLLVIPESD
jgi:tRNA-modifying protein YgfZ